MEILNQFEALAVICFINILYNLRVFRSFKQAYKVNRRCDRSPFVKKITTATGCSFTIGAAFVAFTTNELSLMWTVLGVISFSLILEVISAYYRSIILETKISLLEHVKGSTKGFLFALFLSGLLVTFHLAGFYLIAESKLSFKQGIYLYVAVFALGLQVVALLHPMIYKLFNKVYRPHDTTLLQAIEKRFKEADLVLPEIVIWPDHKVKSAKIYILGQLKFTSLFKGLLIIPESLLKEFSVDEIDVLICNEIAKIKQHHVLKRIWIPIAASILFIYSLYKVNIFFSGITDLSLMTVDDSIYLYAKFAAFGLGLVLLNTQFTKKLDIAQSLDCDIYSQKQFGQSLDKIYNVKIKALKYVGTFTAGHLIQTEKNLLTSKEILKNGLRKKFEWDSFLYLFKVSTLMLVAVALLSITFKIDKNNFSTIRNTASDK